MFSEKLLRLVSHKLQLMRVLGISNLIVDANKQILYCNTDTILTVRMYTTAVLAVLWPMGLILQSWVRYSQKEFGSMNLGLAFVYGGLASNALVISHVAFPKDYCQTINGTLTLFRYLVRKSFKLNQNSFKQLNNLTYENHLGTYTKNTSHGRPKETRIQNLLLAGITFGFLLLYIQITVFLVVDSHGILFVGSLIPSGTFLTCLKLVLFMLNLYVISACLLMTSFFICYFVLYGMNVVLFYTLELRLGFHDSKYCTISTLRKQPDCLATVYRAFQILHQYFLLQFGPILLFADGVLMMNCIYITFVLIRYWNELEAYAKAPLLVQDILGMLVWSGIVEIGRLLNNRGNKVPNSWMRSNWRSAFEQKFIKKFRKSCKPLLLAYGTQYVVRNKSLLMFYKGVIRGTFRMLLSLKRY